MGVLSLTTCVVSAQQSPDTDVAQGEEEGLVLPVLGATFVCPKNGAWYAMSSTLTSKAVLSAMTVYWSGEHVIVPLERGDEFTWIVNSAKTYITTTSGKYLGHKPNTSTNVELFSSKEDCKWMWNEESGCFLHDCTSSSTTKRTMLYNTAVKGFKLYASSNIAGTEYAETAASYVQMLPGYVRSVTAGSYGTLCLPYDAVLADGLQAEFRTVAGKILGDDGEAKELVLSNPVTTLKAGTPYIFYSDSKTLSLAYSGVGTTVPAESNGLVGVLEAVNADKNTDDIQLTGCYMLAGNMLCKCSDGSSLSANRAYIRLEDVPVLPSSFGAEVLRFDSQLTAIKQLYEEHEQCDIIYTLTGVRIQNTDVSVLKPGLYIINGRVQLRR